MDTLAHAKKSVETNDALILNPCVIEPLPSPLTDAWCACDGECAFPEFVGNGYCRCGTWKHHYHCPDCGGVTQVG